MGHTAKKWQSQYLNSDLLDLPVTFTSAASYCSKQVIKPTGFQGLGKQTPGLVRNYKGCVAINKQPQMFSPIFTTLLESPSSSYMPTFGRYMISNFIKKMENLRQKLPGFPASTWQ